MGFGQRIARKVLGGTRSGVAADDNPLTQISYDGHGLKTYGQSLDFLRDARFLSAYRRGMDSGHQIMRPKGSRADIGIRWRVQITCWAAHHASRLPGDFVECGVNTGMHSLAICEYVNFNDLDKTFWLFDTFEGIPADQISESEKQWGRSSENANFYPPCYETAVKNFAPFPRPASLKASCPTLCLRCSFPRLLTSRST